MILVGKYNQEDLIKGRDKKDIEDAKERTGLKYTESRIIKENGVTYIKIWMCSNEEYFDWYTKESTV